MTTRVMVGRDFYSGLIAVGLADAGAALPHVVRVVDTKVGVVLEELLDDALYDATVRGKLLEVDLDNQVTRAELIAWGRAGRNG